jgi:hypothetical protein
MAVQTLLRTSTVVAVCLVLAVSAFPQSGLSGIGPSKGEVIGLSVAAGAVLGVGGYLIYRAAHKHASIQGCIATDQNGLSLQNEKGKKMYALAGDSATLRAGQRVALNGKKVKDSTGKVTFQVQKLTKDYGACQPQLSSMEPEGNHTSKRHERSFRHN